MGFVMQDGWKEEPVSITGASYVEPSISSPLQPGQRIAHMFPRSIMEEYVLQRMTARKFWFSRHFYGTLFYVGERGVLLFDPPQGSAESLLKAIASVTPLPVTALCYSHFHADHIGGARRLVSLLASAPRVIASEHTAVWMDRFGSDLPRPTDILAWPDSSVSFEGTELRLYGLPRPGHSPDHSVFLLADERIGHSADLIVLFRPNLSFAAELPFDWFSGGHGNIGEKSDFSFYLSYMDELAALIAEEIPRPAEVPDLYLTDYLDGLDDEARQRLLSSLDNHFSFYLYGRAIVRGEEPDRSGSSGGGPGGMMGGVVGEWTAERQKLIAEAVPRILERLRPKYGRMYNFDDAQSINIRLLAQSMQVTLPNR
jgi:glyoxylase-like metal-dependent hydrolase (beta-lactamase superfamily II)